MSMMQFEPDSIMPALERLPKARPALIVSIAFMLWLQALVNANSPIKISFLMNLLPMKGFHHLEDQSLQYNDANRHCFLWLVGNNLQLPSKEHLPCHFLQQT